jgi:hypothetical protein
MRNIGLSLIFLNMILTSCAQELIVNPSAESNPVSNGWTVVSIGTNCYTGSNWRITGNQNGFPPAQHGTRYFYSGCGGVNGEIYQNVNVSTYAVDIDAGNQQFTFYGYTRSYNQAPADAARIVVEYRNAASVVIGSYDTGYTTNTSGWVMNGDVRMAPVGTRTIRIRLLSLVNSGPSVDGYFDNLSLTTQLIVPLPVGLINFKANLTEENTVELNWSTASETNNASFTIEHSMDGLTWQDIGSVVGGGNSSDLLDYVMIDRNPSEGLNYYRLKQCDFSGRICHSDIRSIEVLFERDIYPNPFLNEVRIDAVDLKLDQIFVSGSNGNDVSNQVELHPVLRNKFILNFTALQAGIYFIHIGSKTYKVLKM